MGRGAPSCIQNLREQRMSTLESYREGLARLFRGAELASEIVETWTFECAGTPYVAIRIRTMLTGDLLTDATTKGNNQ